MPFLPFALVVASFGPLGQPGMCTCDGGQPFACDKRDLQEWPLSSFSCTFEAVRVVVDDGRPHQFEEGYGAFLQKQPGGFLEVMAAASIDGQVTGDEDALLGVTGALTTTYPADFDPPALYNGDNQFLYDLSEGFAWSLVGDRVGLRTSLGVAVDLDGRPRLRALVDPVAFVAVDEIWLPTFASVLLPAAGVELSADDSAALIGLSVPFVEADWRLEAAFQCLVRVPIAELSRKPGEPSVSFGLQVGLGLPDLPRPDV